MSKRELEIMGKVLDICKVYRFNKEYYKIKLQVKLKSGINMQTIVYAVPEVVVREFKDKLQRDGRLDEPICTVSALKSGDLVYLSGHFDIVTQYFNSRFTKKLMISVIEEIKLLKQEVWLNKIYMKGIITSTPKVEMVDGVPYATFLMSSSIGNTNKRHIFSVTARKIPAQFSTTLKDGDSVELTGYFKTKVHTICPNDAEFDFNTVNLSASILRKI